MAATWTEKDGRYEAREIEQGEVIDLKQFTFYVHLIDGTVREVAPATRLRLTKAEVLFLLGELVVERLPRTTVYFATREPAAMPVLG